MESRFDDAFHICVDIFSKRNDDELDISPTWVLRSKSKDEVYQECSSCSSSDGGKKTNNEEGEG